jgi:hypothetical protein
MVFIHFVRGRLALARGDLSSARENFERQLHFARVSRSPDHPEVLKATLDLGDVLTVDGDLATAERHHTDALALADAPTAPRSRRQLTRGVPTRYALRRPTASDGAGARCYRATCATARAATSGW